MKEGVPDGMLLCLGSGGRGVRDCMNPLDFPQSYPSSAAYPIIRLSYSNGHSAAALPVGTSDDDVGLLQELGLRGQGFPVRDVEVNLMA